MTREDPDVADELQGILGSEGIQLSWRPRFFTCAAALANR
jgi:hypothetical protein